MNFLEKLDLLIKNKGLTRGSFAKGVGIPYTTIMSFYDKGYENIKLSNLKKIADFFDVSLEYLANETPQDPVLPELQVLSKKYSALNEKGRKIVDNVVDGLLDIQSEVTGVSPVEIAYIREYITPAAAGYASPAEGDDYILIPRDESVPPAADFAVRIDGDSMAPYIEDGQRVFAARTNEINPGEVGIFFVDGDMKCKQFFEDNFGNIYLRSANRARADADVFVASESSVAVYCFGKVLMDKKIPTGRS